MLTPKLAFRGIRNTNRMSLGRLAEKSTARNPDERLRLIYTIGQPIHSRFKDDPYEAETAFYLVVNAIDSSVWILFEFHQDNDKGALRVWRNMRSIIIAATNCYQTVVSKASYLTTGFHPRGGLIHIDDFPTARALRLHGMRDSTCICTACIHTLVALFPRTQSITLSH